MPSDPRSPTDVYSSDASLVHNCLSAYMACETIHQDQTQMALLSSLIVSMVNIPSLGSGLPWWFPLIPVSRDRAVHLPRFGRKLTGSKHISVQEDRKPRRIKIKHPREIRIK